MARKFVNRMFVADQATCMTSIPFPKPSLEEDESIDNDRSGSGAALHNLLAIGCGWSMDAQEYHINIIDLALSTHHETNPPMLIKLASFQVDARPTCMCTADHGNGTISILTGCTNGHVYRLRMVVPTAPGSSPESIQLQSDDFDGASLVPWLSMHDTSITAMDVSSDGRYVAAASLDGGCINVADLSLSSSEGAKVSSMPLPGNGVPVTCLQWASPTTIVYGTMQGSVSLIDTGTQIAKLIHSNSDEISCLDVNAAQPHIFAAGDAGGRLQVYDLRRAGSSSGEEVVVGGGVVSSGGVGGRVNDVKFVGSDSSGTYGSEYIVYSTSNGEIGATLARGNVAAARILHVENSRVLGLSCAGQHILIHVRM
jgi:WD40 repeat protein